MKKFCILLFTVLAAFFFSCSNISDSCKEGAVQISLPSVSTRAFSINDVKSYEVSVNGPGFNRSKEADPGNSVYFNGIPEGIYTVKVSAFNSDKITVAEGESEAVVLSGKSTDVFIKLKLISQDQQENNTAGEGNSSVVNPGNHEQNIVRPVIPEQSDVFDPPATGLYAKLVQKENNGVMRDPVSGSLYILCDRTGGSYEDLFRVAIDGNEITDGFTASYSEWSSIGTATVTIRLGQETTTCNVPIKAELKPTNVSIIANDSVGLSSAVDLNISYSLNPNTRKIAGTNTELKFDEISTPSFFYSLYGADGNPIAEGTKSCSGGTVYLTKSDLSAVLPGTYNLKVILSQLPVEAYLDYFIISSITDEKTIIIGE